MDAVEKELASRKENIKKEMLFLFPMFISHLGICTYK